MDERLESILGSVSKAELAEIAAGALGVPSVALSSSPAFSEITTPHNDLRTIGIVRVEGSARTANGEENWSAVVKVIDLDADAGGAAFWILPENEQIVYERGLFSETGVPFRAAKCYGVTRQDPNIKLLWLEDLTAAEKSPFSLSQMELLANNVGRFNGSQAQNPADLPFELAQDSCHRRWEAVKVQGRFADLTASRDHESTREMYSEVPMETALEIVDLLDRVVQRSLTLDHSLSFGDCQPGNLFLVGDETVAIDWGSVTNDPTGVDAGILIGSGITWGTRGVDIAQNERKLFDSYLNGLRESGWSGAEDDVRRAFFGQFGIYLSIVATAPVLFANPGQFLRKEFVEARFQTPWEEIPRLLGGIVTTFPGLVEELRGLV